MDSRPDLTQKGAGRTRGAQAPGEARGVSFVRIQQGLEGAWELRWQMSGGVADDSRGAPRGGRGYCIHYWGAAGAGGTRCGGGSGGRVGGGGALQREVGRRGWGRAVEAAGCCGAFGTLFGWRPSRGAKGRARARVAGAGGRLPGQVEVGGVGGKPHVCAMGRRTRGLESHRQRKTAGTRDQGRARGRGRDGAGGREGRRGRHQRAGAAAPADLSTGGGMESVAESYSSGFGRGVASAQGQCGRGLTGALLSSKVLSRGLGFGPRVWKGRAGHGLAAGPARS